MILIDSERQVTHEMGVSRTERDRDNRVVRYQEAYRGSRGSMSRRRLGVSSARKP